jgi:hypothetical protein
VDANEKYGLQITEVSFTYLAVRAAWFSATLAEQLAYVV